MPIGTLIDQSRLGSSLVPLPTLSQQQCKPRAHWVVVRLFDQELLISSEGTLPF